MKSYIHTYKHTYIHTCIHAYIHTYIQGVSDEFIPPVLTLSEVDEVICVPDGDAILMAQVCFDCLCMCMCVCVCLSTCVCVCTCQMVSLY